jgi:hypothetical protein
MQSFKDFLSEHILSIGFNPDHEKYRETHRSEMHNLIKNAYKEIGGYAGLGHGSKEESDTIHNDISKLNIKAVKRDGKISSMNMYKDQHGRKSVASATDTSTQGKKDFIKTKDEDNKQKRAWGEVSGAVEHLQKKLGVPSIPSSRTKELIDKDVNKHDDGYHYDRKIGAEHHTKVMMGHPKVVK